MKSRRHIQSGGFLKHNSDNFLSGRPYIQNDKKIDIQNVESGTLLSILIEGYLNVFFIKQISLFICFVADIKFKAERANTVLN
jgi:hypothetical protein